MNLMTSSLFLIGLFLTGCVAPIYQNTTYDVEEFKIDSAQIAQQKEKLVPLKSQPNKNDFCCEDCVREGDEITLILYHPQRLDLVNVFAKVNASTGFCVRNGKIYLPYLSFVKVEGLTLQEVKESIQTAYCMQLPSTQIFVNFKKRCKNYVQVIGANTSLIPLSDQMRLSEVLAIAKISPHANLLTSHVMRNGQQLPINLYKLLHEGNESQNIVMQRDDQIFIANAADTFIMVTGEVPQPKLIAIPHGFLSLREALVQAGGISFTGNKTCIQIIRGDLTSPKIYCLNWLDLVHLPNASLLLIPGDVVVISEKPITQWNRFINQTQPSINGMQNAYQVYELFK